MEGVTPLLELRHVAKSFVGQEALVGINLKLSSGQVHALVGHNGSGKSTLIKILSGYHRANPGSEAYVFGEAIELSAVRERLSARFVHQDIGLIKGLDAATNLSLVAGFHGKYWVSHRQERAAAKEWLNSFGLQVDLSAPIEKLSATERRLIVIAFALQTLNTDDTNLIVLDEPTEGLVPKESERVLNLVRGLAERGASVLFVSHRVDEVLAVADDVTVLRDGAVVGFWSKPLMDYDTILDSLIGNEAQSEKSTGDGDGTSGVASSSSSERGSHESTVRAPLESDARLLEVDDLFSGDLVHGVSLGVGPGDILGIAGLDGSGRELLLYSLYGAVPVKSGVVSVSGKRVHRYSVAASIRRGMFLVPRDRLQEAAFLNLTLRENIMVTMPMSSRILRIVSRSNERKEVSKWIGRCDVIPADVEREFKLLSGGNQQKAIMARALRCDPKILLLDEPFQGVDVGTRIRLGELIREAASAGCAIIVAAADPSDLVAVCNRVMVMGSGSVVGEVKDDELTESKIEELEFAGVGTK